MIFIDILGHHVCEEALVSPMVGGSKPSQEKIRLQSPRFANAEHEHTYIYNMRVYTYICVYVYVLYVYIYNIHMYMYM